jgi:hypothetical protein
MDQPALTILIPFFNESGYVASSFESNWSFLASWNESFSVEFRLCVWRTDDSQKTVGLLNELCSRWSTGAVVQVIEGGNTSPSVVGSLNLGFEKPIRSSHILVCPVDCFISMQGFREVLGFLSGEFASSMAWGVFRKRYDRPDLPLRLSSLLQNGFIAPVLGLHCWTNLFLVRTDQFMNCFAQKPFLEDLFANREMHARFGRPHRFKSPAIVSVRRYRKRGSVRQMVTNCRIFYHYLRNTGDLSNLRRLYESKSKS